MDFDLLIDKEFSGAISLRTNGNVMFQKAYGFADIPNKVLNELDTKFQTASAGKVFVAVAILQLIEMRELSFDDTIGKILTFNLKDIDKEITIKQLLCHTSGIPDYFDESIQTEYAELWTDYPNYKIRKSTDLIPLFINKPMMYSAGEKFQYNNTGFVILGLIIEQIIQPSFDIFLSKHIFEPCNMLNTGYFELDRLPTKCANAYIYDDTREEFYTNIYSVDAKGSGAGGAFTTILDIDRFWDNLLNKNLLSTDMVNKMLSLQSSDETSFYGFGMWLEKIKTDLYSPFFQGSDPGVSFVSGYNLENRASITIVSNKGNNVWKLKAAISDLLKAN